MDALTFDRFDTWHAANMAGDTTYESSPCYEPTLCIHHADTDEIKWIGDIVLELFGNADLPQLCLAKWDNIDFAESPARLRVEGEFYFEPSDIVVAEDYYLHVRVCGQLWERYTDLCAK